MRKVFPGKSSTNFNFDLGKKTQVVWTKVSPWMICGDNHSPDTTNWRQRVTNSVTRPLRNSRCWWPPLSMTPESRLPPVWRSLWTIIDRRLLLSEKRGNNRGSFSPVNEDHGTRGKWMIVKSSDSHLISDYSFVPLSDQGRSSKKELQFSGSGETYMFSV